MAENIGNETSSNFSIEGTMDMGSGDRTLLNDLMSPETSTTDPDKVEEIIKQVNDPVVKENVKKGKEIVQKEEGEAPTNQDTLRNFLNDGQDEEEEPAEEAAVANQDEEELTQDENQFTALSRDLFKLGVFSKDDEEDEVVINTPQEFLEKFNNEKKKGAIEMVNSFIGRFGEDYQNAFEAIYVNGMDPREYFTTYNNIVGFSEMDLTKEENQIRVMTQALTDQGFEQEDVTTEIERIKNYGDLETVAAKHHKALVKKEAIKLKEKEEQASKELEQKAGIRNQYIQNVQQILQEKLKAKDFDGIPINVKLAEELQDFLLIDKWKTPSGETLTEFDKTILELKRPENHAMKVKLALILKILEKDPTLSTIQRSAISKKSDQLFGEVARQVVKTKTPVKQGVNKSWFS